MKIKNIQTSAFLQNLTKAYTEGVYADTPANRKLGRVGMSYAQYAQKVAGGDKEQKSKEEVVEKQNIKEEKEENKVNLQKVNSMEDVPFEDIKLDEKIWYFDKKPGDILKDATKLPNGEYLAKIDHSKDKFYNPYDYIVLQREGREKGWGPSRKSFKGKEIGSARQLSTKGALKYYNDAIEWYNLSDKEKKDKIEREKEEDNKRKELNKKESFLKKNFKFHAYRGGINEFKTIDDNITITSPGYTDSGELGSWYLHDSKNKTKKEMSKEDALNYIYKKGIKKEEKLLQNPFES